MLGTDEFLNEKYDSSNFLEIEAKMDHKPIINRRYLYELFYDGSLFYETYIEKTWNYDKSEYFESICDLGRKKEFNYFIAYIKEQLKQGIGEISFFLQQETECPIEDSKDNTIHTIEKIDLSTYQFHDFEFSFKLNIEYIFTLSDMNSQLINVNMFKDYYYLMGSNQELTITNNNEDIEIIQLDEQNEYNPFSKKYLYKLLTKKLYYSENGVFNGYTLRKGDEVKFISMDNRYYFNIFIDYIKKKLILVDKIHLIIQREVDNLDTLDEYNKIKAQEIIDLSKEKFNDKEFSFKFNKEYIFTLMNHK